MTPEASASWMRARAALRMRWRGWLGLALLLGIAGGFVASAAAGARRTASVYERLLLASAAFDLAVTERCRNATEGGGCAEQPRMKIDALPSVAATASVTNFLLPVTTAAGRSLQPGGDTCFT